MRMRLVTLGAAAVALVSLAVAAWVLSRADFGVPAGVTGRRPQWTDLVAPISWTLTGATLLWVRPRNRVGALLLFAGACQAVAQAADAYGMYGLGIAEPHWPGANWVAFLGSPLWVPGLLPLITLLPAIYPNGRLPGPRWRLPAAAVWVGTGLLTLAMLGPGAYDDIAPGPPPVTIEAHGAFGILFAITMAVCFLGGAIAMWVMSVVRLVRSRPPERTVLLWLLSAMVLLVIAAASQSGWSVLTAAVPVAVAVGVFRYNLFGIEAVLRRGLVYTALTAVVIGVYLAVTAVAGGRLEHGPLPGVVAAALVAVGLTPVRERLQRGVDRLVYGDRRDPMRAVANVGDTVAAAGQPEDLLPSVLATVTHAMRAPGARVDSNDGRELAAIGTMTDGQVLPLRVSGRDVGTLRVAARRPGETYTDSDRLLLTALAPQVAVVVRALDLAEALEAERDRVVHATRTERDRLRRDLHDGLGPSLSGVSLGLQAVDTALARRDERTASELLHRIQAETDIAVHEIRRILDDLRPAALDEAGLVAVMKRHAESIAAGVAVDVDLPPHLPPLSPDVETAAYRIAQEALTNVVKHADARLTRLGVTLGEGTLRIEVTDDGHGFQPDVMLGVGLASMRHRAEAVGGILTVSSCLQGTTVVATLPVGPAP